MRIVSAGTQGKGGGTWGRRERRDGRCAHRGVATSSPAWPGRPYPVRPVESAPGTQTPDTRHHRLLHVCRCVTSCVKGSGNPKGAPHRWSSPLPPAPCPCPSHTSLPWQRQWAVPRLPSYPPASPGSASGRSHGCAPPSPLSCGACGRSHGCNPPPPFPCSAGARSHGCTPSPSLPLQRRWAIPRLRSPPPPTTRPITPPAEWSSGQPHELLSGSRGFESLPSPRAPNLGNTV